MPRLTIRWITFFDDRTCPVCLMLDGHQWQFTTGVDPFPDLLNAVGQDVWNCSSDTSMAHSGDQHNCRCRLNWIIDDSDLAQKIRDVNISLLEVYGQIESWSGMGAVKVLRQHGRFVTWRKL